MGFFSRGPKRVRIPNFSVGIFGKLPCYKDFLFSSCHPAFTEAKSFFDRGFDALIRSGITRPYVSPNRRLFMMAREHKAVLVGCVFESDDGLRGFPFFISAVFPLKAFPTAFSDWWQVLERVWTRLEELEQQLRVQESPSGVNALIRGVAFELETFTPEEWDADFHEKAGRASVELNQGLFTVIDLSETCVDEERTIIQGIDIKKPPAFVLWPAPAWRDHHQGVCDAYLGLQGVHDLRLAFFPPKPEAPADEAVSEDD